MVALPNADDCRTFTFKQAVAAFFSVDGLPFADVLSEHRIAAIFQKHQSLFGRTYTTAIVLWAFMSQVLRHGKEASCQSAVGRIQNYWMLLHGRSVDPDTRDYCRARAKLSEDALRELSRSVAVETEQHVDPKHLFKGRHAKLIDGSTFMMPDTQKNQQAYPQNPAQKPGIGFPIARFVVVVSLATACVIDAAIGRYKGKETGETALLRQLLSCFSPGDVAVADRYYGNYWTVALFWKLGIDVCFRKHQMRQTDFRRGKRLGKNDHLVTWHRPARPSWMSKAVYAAMPETIRLREIKFTISKPGRKQKPFVIITTLFNEDSRQEFSLEEIAELFHFRWNAELDIRSIKTHMNLHHLRCKSPAMVHREFWTTMLAYNAIRTTAACSSWLEGIPPREISFVSCCQYVLSAWDILICTEHSAAYCLSKLEDISRCKVGDRPDRYEPRVKKKRGSNYNLMMQPREELRKRLKKGDNSFETK